MEVFVMEKLVLSIEEKAALQNVVPTGGMEAF